MKDADPLAYMRNINTSPGPNAGRSIDPTQPGPDADRIAELSREIVEQEDLAARCLTEHKYVFHGRAQFLRAELSHLRNEQPPGDAIAQSDAQPDPENRDPNERVSIPRIEILNRDKRITELEARLSQQSDAMTREQMLEEAWRQRCSDPTVRNDRASFVIFQAGFDAAIRRYAGDGVTDEMVEAASRVLTNGWPGLISSASMRAALEAAARAKSNK